MAGDPYASFSTPAAPPAASDSYSGFSSPVDATADAGPMSQDAFNAEAQKRFKAGASSADLQQFAKDSGYELKNLDAAINSGSRNSPVVSGLAKAIDGAGYNLLGPQVSRAAADAGAAISTPFSDRSLGQNMAAHEIAADQTREQFAKDHPYISTGLNVIGSIPAALASEYSAITGGLTGAANSTEHSAGGILEDTAIGAGGGLLANGAVRAVAGAVAPVVPRAVQILRDAGVTMTPGQAFRAAGTRVGNFLSGLEDKATSLPIVGDMISAGRRDAQKSYAIGAINRALAPIGRALPPVVDGHQGIAIAKGAMKDAYDRATSQMRMIPDAQLGQDLADIGGRASDGTLSGDASNQLRRTAWSVLGHRIPAMRDVPSAYEAAAGSNLPVVQGGRSLIPSGGQGVGPYTGAADASAASRSPSIKMMDGKTFKSVDSELRKRAGQTQDPALKQAFTDMRNAVRDAANRSSSPEAVADLNAADQGYANFVRVRRAAAGSDNGNFSPNQLQTSVRVHDTSIGKGRTAEGEALMQDYAQAGKDVLPSRTGDSGTAGRSASMNPIAWAAGAGLTPFYMGARAARPFLTREAGAQAQSAAALLRASAPAISGVAAPYIGPPAASGAGAAAVGASPSRLLHGLGH